jgi:hypothetical protein
LAVRSRSAGASSSPSSEPPLSDGAQCCCSALHVLLMRAILFDIELVCCILVRRCAIAPCLYCLLHACSASVLTPRFYLGMK